MIDTAVTRESWRRDLLVVGTMFLVTRLIVVIAAYAGAAHPNPGYPFHTFGGTPPSPWLAPFVRWDAQTYYIDLARNGYPPPRADGPVFHAAFFPLYPLAVRALDLLVGNTFVSALVLSNVLALIAALLLCQLSRVAGHSDRNAALLFLAAPGADFLSFPYSESLFCVLASAGLLAVLADRALLAGLAGSLASATRPTGLVIAVALLALAWERRHNGRKVACLVFAAALSTTGLVGYAVFCQLRYGDALYFTHIQAEWERHFSLLGPLHALLAFRFDPDYYLVTLAALAGAVWMLRRKTALVLTLPAWFLLLIPLATGSLKSMIRFQSANIPLLAGVAPMLRPIWFRGVMAVSLLLLAWETYAYAAGYAHN